MVNKPRSKPKQPFFFPKLRRSLYVLWTSAKFRRLFQEDKGVEGVGWYAKNREDFWHIPLNTLRFIILIIFAPVYAIFRLSPVSKVIVFNTPHIEEPVCTPDAILYKSPSDGQPGSFGTAGHYPRWMLKVTFRGLERPIFKQVPVNSEVVEAGYIAISYSMASAFWLFQEAGLHPKDPPPSKSRQWSLRDRKRISRRVLYEYAGARVREGIPDSTEYIWLDEFCLSSATLADEEEIEKEIMVEVGQLADIFRNAKKVIVFCHLFGCKHTTLDCPWGKRVFTIAEILHAQSVITMTRCSEENSTEHLIEWDARNFKGQMQLEAAKGRQFHLSTILQHATNAGSGSWQSVIQALVVEAIRRDEAGNYVEHSFLGKVLNGLLPRRARLEDLRGKDGWADLAWLLELNQGYYNAAGLAAVCNVNLTPTGQGSGLVESSEARVAGYRWWGKPISPLAGNERLEPIATAFPVVVEQDDSMSKDDPKSEPKQVPVLSILAPKTIRIHHTLRRDREGLYRHEDMVGLRNWMYFMATIMTHIGIPFIAVRQTGEKRLIAPGSILLYCAFVLVVFVELLASTVYVLREGWLFLPDERWGADPSDALGEQDPRFKRLREWGERQLVPRWDTPSPADGENRGHRLVSGSLVDMKSKVYTKVVVIDGAYPDLMVELAVHGTGITGILLQKPDGHDAEEEDLPAEKPETKEKGRAALNNSSKFAERDSEEEVPIQVFTKVGMANLPAYVLSKSEYSGTIFIGGHLPATREARERTWARVKRKNINMPFRRSRQDSISTAKTDPRLDMPKADQRGSVDLEKGKLDEAKDEDFAGEFFRDGSGEGEAEPEVIGTPILSVLPSTVGHSIHWH